MTTELSTPVLSRECFGVLLVTPGVKGKVPFTEIGDMIQRHMSNDWGVVGEDADANAQVVQACADKEDDPGRIMSVYELSEDLKVWIITYPRASAELQVQPDYCYTTVLLPDEY